MDGHSALASLRTDKSMEADGIFLELGRPKNVNKNAVVDKAIRELREQLVRLSPKGGPYSESVLARATSYLNEIIRHTGRSAKEIWVSRNLTSGTNMTLADMSIPRVWRGFRVSDNLTALPAYRDWQVWVKFVHTLCILFNKRSEF